MKLEGGQASAAAALYAAMRSLAHWFDFVEVISTEPSFCLKFPVTDVPGETPMSPVKIVVSPPLNAAEVPAMTANSAHSPRGTDVAPARLRRLLALVTTAMIVAITTSMSEKNLDVMVLSVCCGLWQRIDCVCDE